MPLSLDDPQVFREYDPEGMLASISDLPSQCRQAWEAAMGFKIPAGYSDIDNVVIAGMGGSAIGGDLLRGLVAAEAKVPVLVHRDYHLPAFVGSRTLVIASSYSGNTEETISAFEQALTAGAKIVVVTGGGKLKAAAQQKGIPVFTIDYKAQPRAAVGFGLMSLLCILQKLDLLGDKSGDVAEMVQALGEMAGKMNSEVAAANNPAKQIAQRLHGLLPIIYGAGIIAEVAHRWKTQINENSKAWSFYEVFPELNHNAVVGYQFPAELISRIRVVMLRSPSLEQRMRLRYDITAQLLKRAGVGCEYVDGMGNSALTQVMSLVLFGDYVSYYLAILYRINPSQVKVIDYLKGQLAKG